MAAEALTRDDRCANLEISYLLQRLEDYAGIAFLATNLRGKIDDAFLYRKRPSSVGLAHRYLYR